MANASASCPPLSGRPETSGARHGLRRILLITSEYPPDSGGISRFMGDVVVALSPHRVSVLAAADPVGPREARRGAVVESRLAGALSRRRFLSSLQGLALLGPALRLARHADLVLCSGASHTVLVPAAVVRVIHGVPFACFVHGYDVLHVARRPTYQRVLTELLGGAYRLMANSHRTARELYRLGLPSDSIAVVHPVVASGSGPVACAHDRQSVRRALGLDDTPLVLGVGALVRRKGHDRMLEALALLAAEGLSLRYAVVGDGPERRALERQAATLGLGGKVRFVGRVTDAELDDWYSSADIFAMPSRDLDGDIEGFGIVFLEAALHSVPAVAGRAGGMEDAVVDGVTGLTVDPESASDIASAIRRLADDPELRRRLGESARQRATADFSVSALGSALRSCLSL